MSSHFQTSSMARTEQKSARVALAYGAAAGLGVLASLAAFQSGVPGLAIASLGVAAATRRIRGARSHRLGPYTLESVLGEGAMGAVYRASHRKMDRPVALKILPAERNTEENAARFALEAEMTARLTHPSTVRVLDRGRAADGTPYYAMECLEGATLADAIAQDGPMTASRAIDVLDQIAGALAEAHSIGIIHRDIKPANIFLARQADGHDAVKVLDFGLVKRIGPARGADVTQPAMTHADSFAGTPLYMAPEAITTPDAVDGRTDLYALGAVGYFLVTGHDVFTGRSVPEVCGHHLHSVPVPPSHRLGAPIPAALEALILSCLEKDPSRRPADATALRAALRACRDADSIS